MHGVSSPGMQRLFVAALVAAGLAAGCSTSERYPDHIRYSLRKDLLVKDKAKELPRVLHVTPGQLDASIRKLRTDNLAKTFDPAELKAEVKKDIRSKLDAIFGTPGKPTVLPENKDTDALRLDPVSLRNGSKHYRRHCMHCHGVSGDGRGPTGPWLHPPPRDYRQGQFKFISTTLDESRATGRKPRRADLLRVISKGIDGTSMPSFGLLPERELEELVSYVIHLSIRGEVEFNTMSTILAAGGDPSGLAEGVEGYIEEWTGKFLDRWAQADREPPNAPPAEFKYPEDYEKDQKKRMDSAGRGYRLFIERGCAACHEDFGRQASYRYDDWGTLVRPNNLTAGTYRGGRRIIDLYWRITGGIGPSGMPSNVPIKANPPGTKPEAMKLTHAEIWDLVNFVQALPYPAMLPQDVRKKVYGASEEAASAKVAEASR